MSLSPNHYNGRNGWKADIIVCHVTEGSFNGSVDWLCNTASQASPHFIIGENGETEQLVDLSDGSWCNGTSTNSSHNTFCGKSTNRFVRGRATNANFYTYSIEHEGYSYKKRYGALTEEQYQASLNVMKQIITHMKDMYGITFIPDREHLIGHCDVSPITKPACPAPNNGYNFPFDRFLDDIKLWMGITQTPGYVQMPLILVPHANINVGDMVKVNRGAKTYTGSEIANFVYNNVYRVDEISGLRAVLDKFGICTPVNVNDVTVKISATPEPPMDMITTGSMVRVKNNAKSYESNIISDSVYSYSYRVDAIAGDRAVLDKRGICTAFNVKDLIRA